MKVQVLAKGTGMPGQAVTTPSPDLRGRAIQAFNAQGQKPAQAPQAQPVPPQAQPQQQIVENQNQISPEELTAIQPASRQPEGNEDTTSTQESPAEAPKTATPQQADPLSKQYAILARQEKALRAKQLEADKALKSRESALAAREAELTAKLQEYEKNYISKDFIKSNSLQALMDSGASYDELTQQFLNSQTPIDPRVQATITQLQAKIKQLEQAAESTQNQFKSSQQQQYEAAVNQIRQDAKKLINSDPNFQTAKAAKATNDVVELITKTYEETGEIMSVEEAAEHVENELIERIEKLARIEKIQKRLNPVAPARAATQTQANSTKQPPAMKTLTNATSSTRQLSARERAILAFNGEKKT